MAASYSFTSSLWEWSSRTTWFFFSVPEEIADEIEEQFGRSAAGFGSVRVEVTVGATTWRTSIFPSTSERTYVLPVKKAVRKAEGLEAESVAEVELAVLVD